MPRFIPKLFSKEGSRYLLWPVRLKWSPHVASFGWHGWQVGTEPTTANKTAYGFMPGYRSVFGQTISVGPLKVLFGGTLTDAGCTVQAPPRY